MTAEEREDEWQDDFVIEVNKVAYPMVSMDDYFLVKVDNE